MESKAYSPDMGWIYSATQRHSSRLVKECGHRLGERWILLDEAASRMQTNPHEHNAELVVTQLCWLQKDLAELIAALIIPESSGLIKDAVKGALSGSDWKRPKEVQFLECVEKQIKDAP